MTDKQPAMPEIANAPNPSATFGVGARTGNEAAVRKIDGEIRPVNLPPVPPAPAPSANDFGGYGRKDGQ